MSAPAMDRDQTYVYDPETCSFKEVETTWTEWAARAGQIVGLAVILTGLLFWGIDQQWIVSPSEKTLRVENTALEQQLDRVNSRMTTLSARLDTLAKKDRTLYRRLFQMKPISEDVRQVGVGGADPYRQFDELGADTEALLKNTAQQLDKLERQMSLQKSSYKELYSVAKQRQDRLRQLPAIRPANGRVVSNYGMRDHPILKVRKMHEGIDFLLKRGTPVMATAEGVVQRAEHNPGYGKVIEVKHPESEYMTRYAHLSEIPDKVYRGAEVQRGDTIGYSGNSGLSTGPHLHYEVRRLDGSALNPMRFLMPDMSPESYRTLERRTQQYRASAGGSASPASAR
ncbi:M23 family metallopeptidase [Salinibacter ruber]|uniref:M23 family metallopeptidase n=2 Tax=Salinibacter ruber TaxID=146919 RepID=UPI0021553B63|nr:M23 family metallopeptidase [Salinibacter ruber]MCS3646232.1 murein DD-endopeptidase MepM/ murein hydrolase activator NlpD [Salinibacter ruber]MCS3666037.1 murein DD-endopeptidase MepM/ murein hydrolase activator NlpD [Salinibacter ruber]MCS3784553.1 murein DD-endopeptidase MepM/ murein hydrolase activator NlpD [Salinibacter ruber]MCS4195722.1 murein DD-endopeptidase MepM/ murein hydrolase activator NlpD [Salinibacter ruber]